MLGVQDNEGVDKVAKKATGWMEEARGPLAPACKQSEEQQPSAAQMETRTRAKENWNKSWIRETHGRTTRRLTKRPPKEVLQEFKQMSRPGSAVTDRKKKDLETPPAQDGGGGLARRAHVNRKRQTVQHTLLDCAPGSNELWEEMWAGTRIVDLTNPHFFLCDSRA